MHIIKSEYEQVVNYLRENRQILKTAEDYQPIVTDICTRLNYKEIQRLLNEFGYNENNPIGLYNYIEEKTVLIMDKTYGEIIIEIHTAERSLSTPEFIAYLVGTYITIKEELSKNPFFYRHFTRITNHIEIIIEKSIELLVNEIDRSTSPIYALSYFFLHSKEEATEKFNEFLFRNREYFEIINYEVVFDNFFNRLKIDFIPKLVSKSYSSLGMKQFYKIYINRVEIYNLITQRDFKNANNIPIDPKILLKVKKSSTNNKSKFNINEDNLIYLEEILHMFFNKIHKKSNPYTDLSITNVRVFCKFLTEINLKESFLKKNDVGEARVVLKELLTDKNDSIAFLDLIYNLDFITKCPKDNLSKLISKFFDLKNFSYDTVRNHLYTKRNIANYKILDVDLKNYVENVNKNYQKTAK